MPKTVVYALIALLALGLSGAYAAEEGEQQQEQDPVTTLSKELFKVLTPQQQQQQQQTPQQQQQQQAPQLQAPAGLPEATQPELPGMRVPEMKKVEPRATYRWSREVNCPGTTDCDGDGHHASHHGGDDCHDGDASRFPGNVEVADDDYHDEDCDPSTYGFRDEDGDGYGAPTSCNVQMDGTLLCGNDCDDADHAFYPGTQICTSETEVLVCRGGHRTRVESRTMKITKYAGTGPSTEAASCGKCVTQPNGMGVCVSP